MLWRLFSCPYLRSGAGTPGKRKVVSSPAKPLPQEVLAGIEKLRAHVDTLPSSPTGRHTLPRSFNNHLGSIACTSHRLGLGLGCAT